jgi:hypothetical protein
VSKDRIELSRVAKFLADDGEMRSMRRIVERENTSFLVMDGKREAAAVNAPSRGGRQRGDHVKIIDPFAAHGEPGTGRNPLADAGTREPRRRRNGKERMGPDRDGG